MEVREIKKRVLERKEHIGATLAGCKQSTEAKEAAATRQRL